MDEEERRKMQALMHMLEEASISDLDYLRLLLRRAKDLERLAEHTDTLIAMIEWREARTALFETWRKNILAFGGMLSVVVLFREQLKEVWDWLMRP